MSEAGQAVGAGHAGVVDGADAVVRGVDVGANGLGQAHPAGEVLVSPCGCGSGGRGHFLCHLRNVKGKNS